MKVKLSNLVFQHGLSTILFLMVCLSKTIPFINVVNFLDIMACYQPGQELKEKLNQLFDSDVKIDKVLWELLPVYFKVKIPELKVVSIGLKTNKTGSEMKISVLVVNTISVEHLSTILAVLDLISLSTSNSWMPYSYSFDDIADIEQGHKLYKYIFDSTNSTNENLAGEKVICFNSY